MMHIFEARGVMVDLGYDHNDRPTKQEVRDRIEAARGSRGWKYMESQAMEFLEYLKSHRVPVIGFVAG